MGNAMANTVGKLSRYAKVNTGEWFVASERVRMVCWSDATAGQKKAPIAGG